MKLGDLKIGDKARILGFQANNKGQNSAYRHRLLAMGLTPQTTFTLMRIAPLGDPIEISVRGFSLSLRKKEAALLSIEKIEEAMEA